MTLPAVIPVDRYTGNGSNATYAFNWLLPTADALLVMTYDPVNDAGAILVLGVDYTLPATALNNPQGGSITLIAGNLGAGITLTLVRILPFDQTTSIRNQGDFYPYVHEDTFDRLVMQVQQLNEAISRAVTLPVVTSPDDFDPSLPRNLTAAPNKFIMVNPGGTGFTVGNQTNSLAALRTAHAITNNYHVPDAVDVVICSALAANVVLPSAVLNAGRQIYIKCVFGGTPAAVTVTSAAGLIDGVTTAGIDGGRAAQFISDGANWWLFGWNVT